MQFMMSFTWGPDSQRRAEGIARFAAAASLRRACACSAGGPALI